MQELAVLDEFENEHYFPPERNWPIWEFQYRCTCRWALSEIREAMTKRHSVQVIDILADFYELMDTAAAESSDIGSECKSWTFPPPELIFSVAREVATEVAGLYL